MAGNYPDAPSWRMAIDRDGTQLYKIDTSNVITQLLTSDLVKLNNEGADYYSLGGANAGGTLLFIFPELRDLDAYTYIHRSGVTPNTVQVSTSVDTTNGLDGTWVNLGSSFVPTSNLDVVPAYRTTITSGTALAIRAVKFVLTAASAKSPDVAAIHLYGEPAPGENPNRLALWHPTLDQRVSPAYFDWGNVPRSSSADRTFRVKNLSSTLTANSVRVAMESLTDASPSVPGWHSVSSDGTTFLAQVNIGALAPGAISGVLTVRRITPSNAALSVWSLRLFAESTTTWT